VAKLHLLRSVGALSLIASAAPALGQEAASAGPPAASQTAGQDTGPGDVIVTARRREERLEDVPAAASAFSGEELRAFNVESGIDLTQFTPGLYVINNGSGINNEFVIRGEGTTRANNVETGSGLYRDEMYIPGGNAGGRDFAPIDFFDVERVEVLRGPQGSYFGRNSVGGAVNIITQRPRETPGGYVELRAGSQEVFRAEAVVNVPLSDALALRVGGFSEIQRGGFYRSNIDGRQLDREKSYGVRAQLAFTPSSALTVRLLAEYADQDAPRPEVFEFVLPVNDPPFNAPGPSGFAIDRFSKPIDTSTRFTRAIETYRADVSLDLGAVTLKSITGLRKRYATSSQDVDFQAANAIQRLLNATGVASEPFQRFYQDLRLTSSGGGSFFWLIGAEYTEVDSTLRQLTNALVPTVAPAGCTAAIACTLGALQNAARNAFRDQVSGLDDESYAAYAAVTLDLTDRLSLSADGRYTIDEKGFSNVETRRLDNPATPANESFGRTFNIGRRFERFTPGASLTYAITPNTNIYARVATAYRSGGFNNDQGEPNDGVSDVALPVAYDPESVIGYEVGVKGRLGRQRFAVSAYYVDKSDSFINYGVFVGCPATPVRAGCPANTVRNVGAIANAGKSHQYGVEAEANGQLFNSSAGRLNYRASITWADGQHDEGALPTNTNVNPATSLVFGPLDGLRQARLREWTMTGTLGYSVPVSTGLELFSNIQGRAELGGFEDARNTIPFDDVVLFNATAGIGGDAWQLSLQVRNLFQADYFNINPLNPQFGTQVNEPRTFLVRFSHRFGGEK
jgi:iron complex outermembrane receptor protein